MSTVAYVLAFAFLAAVQGVLLRSACTVCEVDPRGYGASVAMAWVAWLGSSALAFVWNMTFGWLVWMVVGGTVTSILAAGVGWLTATLIVKRWLGLGFVHAGVVWTLYVVAAALLSGLVYGALGLLF